MKIRNAPIYEVTFFVDHGVVEEFDRWLQDHVRQSLRNAAIADCRVLSIPDDADGRAGRVCQHVLETDDALDEFLDGPGTNIETDVAAAFVEQVVILEPAVEFFDDAMDQSMK